MPTVPNQHKIIIQKLKKQLNKLEQEVQRHDQNLSPKASKLLQDYGRFNHELFWQTGGQLSPCIALLEKSINQLETQLQLGLSSNTINLTCEKIQDRFTALKRALQSTKTSIKDASQTKESKQVSWQRRQKQQHQTTGFDWIAASVMQNSHQLYAELNKHLNWAKKIEQKIAESQSLLEKCPDADKIKLQNNILAMHRRLGKCQQAISYIEDRIQYLERPRTRN